MNFIETAFRSYVCKNLTNTEFLLTLISEQIPRYRLFLAIITYEKREYRRALHILASTHTTTSLYYQALCHQKLDNEQKSIALLERLIAGESEPDTPTGSSFDILLIRPTDTLFFYDQVADAHIQNANAAQAMPYLNRAQRIFPLYTTMLNYRAGDRCGKPKNAEKPSKVAEKESKDADEGLQKSHSSRPKNAENTENTPKGDDTPRKSDDGLLALLNDFATDCGEFSVTTNKMLIESYKRRIPGLGSYFLAHAGKTLVDAGRLRSAVAVFEQLRAADPTFLEHLDFYSTALWQLKSRAALGLLARDALSANRQSHVSWAILGNYFSAAGDHSRAALCFRRSILIRRSAYGYTLLGHESILRSDYKMAADCFRSAIRMQPRNFNAFFGLGIVESKVGDFGMANRHLSRAMGLNPENNMLRLIYLQVLNRHKRQSEAIRFFAEIYVDRLDSGTNEVNGSNEVNKFASKKIIDSSNESLIEILNESFIQKVTAELRQSKEEIDEHILLEFVELLVGAGLLDEANSVLGSVSGRSRMYYLKKSMVDIKIAQRDLGHGCDDSVCDLY